MSTCTDGTLGTTINLKSRKYIHSPLLVVARRGVINKVNKKIEYVHLAPATRAWTTAYSCPIQCQCPSPCDKPTWQKHCSDFAWYSPHNSSDIIIFFFNEFCSSFLFDIHQQKCSKRLGTQCHVTVFLSFRASVMYWSHPGSIWWFDITDYNEPRI